MHALDSAPRRLLSLIAVVALALTAVVVVERAPADAVSPGGTVYIARAYDFPDALVGATIAASTNAPILTVRGPDRGDRIPEATRAELERLDPSEIVIFGGSVAVSDKVAEELEAFTSPPGNVSRLAGATRFETAVEIAQALPDKVADADLLDGLDSDVFARSQDVTRHWVARGPNTVETVTIATQGGAAPLNTACVEVDVPASGVLEMHGTVNLDNDSGDSTIAVTEVVSSGASTQLNTDGSFGDRDVMSYNGFIEVDEGDDGTYCLPLLLQDEVPEPTPGTPEEIEYRAARFEVTFVPASHVSIATP